ncbi:tyrosine-type recombinase/integrase [Actinophytocola sp.]|uniref:tyrosine-type recombinase/integrase n=1 Tax=Actinophytocola sp. TaxID=1872138 RepID=UPI002D7EC11F|nr:tyrosine-type recombinase/integrase [Actinophytocola sp.]HET9140182.1 tyrosine-type recombinase/integrase [Actinophytocola sp.]
MYESYWNRIIEHWGTRPLDEPTPSEIHQLAAHVKAHVVSRRNARGGRSAAEHLIAALRCPYRHAENDGHISAADNPARKVTKPRRLPSDRRAVPADRLAEINHIAATTGSDPALDTLILRLHTETACRRGGALALRPCDLDTEQCLIRLREKGETVRWQPVSPTLMAHLEQHAQHRHAPANGQLLRYATGRPITSRRYDHLWVRIGRHLPWVATQQISTHWLRHTTLTWVERNFGYAVARAYAGHTDNSNAGTTATCRTVVLETRYTPESSGEIQLGFAGANPGRLYVDGNLILDKAPAEPSNALGASILNPPSLTTAVAVNAGRPIAIRGEFSREVRTVIDGALSLTVGIEPNGPTPRSSSPAPSKRPRTPNSRSSA